MYSHSGQFKQHQTYKNRIKYDIDTTPGNSGSPVYRMEN